MFYIPIVNGVTKRSRRFLHFQGSLIYNSSLNFGDFIFIEEIPAVSHLLPAMTAGFVRCVNDDLPDISVYDRRYQVRHIRIFILKKNSPAWDLRRKPLRFHAGSDFFFFRPSILIPVKAPCPMRMKAWPSAFSIFSSQNLIRRILSVRHDRTVVLELRGRSPVIRM